MLALVPADRRATLIAKRKPSSGNVVYTLDVHLQNGGRRRPEGDTPQERVRMTKGRRTNEGIQFFQALWSIDKQAAPILLLASDEANYITESILPVAGDDLG